MDLLSKTIKETGLTRDVQKHIKVGIRAIMECVREWAPQKQLRDLQDQLASVFVKAIELSHLLRRQWAVWDVCFPRRPLDLQGSARDVAKNSPLIFDPSSM